MKGVSIILLLFFVNHMSGQESNISLKDLSKLSVTSPDAVLSYGDDSLQFGTLRIPKLSDDDLAPVVVLLHGGCWLSAYDLHLMDPMATDLVSRGFAVWNIEYRKVGDQGGGFPGTFNDVMAGINHLVDIEKQYPVDLDQVILMGHSAGGHLALWAALPKSDEIDEQLRVSLKGIVSLAGITDLEHYYEPEEGKCGSSIGSLMGGSPDDVSERYHMFSPYAFSEMPIGITMVQGLNDRIVPHDMVQKFHEKFKNNSDVHLVSVRDGGHFDVISPNTTSWHYILEACYTFLTQ